MMALPPNPLIARGAAVAIPASMTFVPQLLVWKVLYGKLFSMPPNAVGLGYIFQRRPALLLNIYFRIAALCLCTFNWILMFRYFTHDLPEYGFVSWYDLYLKTLAFPFRILTRS